MLIYALMRNIFFYTLIFFVICCTATGCTKQQKQDSLDSTTPIRSVPISYATNFSIDHFETYTRVIVYNPWQKNTILQTYYLVENISTTTPDNGIKIQIPIHTLVVNSCSHIEFICMLNELESIVGISSPELVFNPIIRQRVANGKIENMGDAFAMNIEKILIKKPNAIMVTGYNQMSDSHLRLETTHIPIIVNIEWMEASSLGRAEWIKFIAAFYKQEEIADSLFQQVEKNYKELLALAQTVPSKPSIASGNSFKGTWYLPGGNSFMGKLYYDAGGDYVFAKDSSSGSLPLSFEVAMKDLRHCDIWLGSNANSLHELVQMDSRLMLFDAYKNKQVYNYSKRTTPSGGNDYWESAIARPDILLKDLIKVLHPNLLPDYELFYINRLE